MQNKDCPCKKLKCPRHGDCDACRAYHAEPGRKYPCACDKKKKAELTGEGATSGTDDFDDSSFANKCELAGLKNKMNR